ncbi:hypothetical protein [Mesorhizobium marinum]|uniref:hypothetical protein n=1 Tax=Mesorhizobium marinum TaxID=3228790 RepID=UPI0034672C17
MAPKSSMFAKLTAAFQSVEQDVSAIRTRRLTAIAKRAEIESAPVTDEVIAQRIDAGLAEAVQRARNWMAPETLSAPDGSFAEFTRSAMRDEPLGTLVVLGLGDAIRAQIMADALEARTGKPMAEELRQAEIERLTAEIGSLEESEWEAIKAAEAVGVNIPLRADCDMSIVLAEDN